MLLPRPGPCCSSAPCTLISPNFLSGKLETLLYPQAMLQAFQEAVEGKFSKGEGAPPIHYHQGNYQRKIHFQQAAAS